MKTSRKSSLIIFALALLAYLVWFILRPSEPDQPDEPVGVGVTEISGVPSFEVRVVKPRLARPFFGLIPEWLVTRLDGSPSELRFDHTSRGAAVGSVGQDRLELRADGWDLLIETDTEGRVASGTNLLFPLELGGRQVRLRCRPADRANGYLRTATRAGSDVLDGGFLVELANCKNADSGKAIEWPPAPLTLRGSFQGLPQGRR